VLDVLSLYDREDGEPFTLADAEALTAFAVQAAVAIENVQLHAEAERLSVTDPLTGAWNYRLTVSIGVACFPEHATATEELLRAADEALYEAKLQGRDRVVTAGPRLLPLTARPGQVKGRAARVE
jgi:diguanylate cyclase (GGDEF)-like protein